MSVRREDIKRVISSMVPENEMDHHLSRLIGVKCYVRTLPDVPNNGKFHTVGVVINGIKVKVEWTEAGPTNQPRVHTVLHLQKNWTGKICLRVSGHHPNYGPNGWTDELGDLVDADDIIPIQ